jgi:hypothetical protein
MTENDEIGIADVQKARDIRLRSCLQTSCGRKSKRFASRAHEP